MSKIVLSMISVYLYMKNLHFVSLEMFVRDNCMFRHEESNLVECESEEDSDDDEEEEIEINPANIEKIKPVLEKF